ncbi:MAG: DNA alkylation repair protein [Bacteroidetes bacterium]|jgi:3-methyladenine DNA glycosylase AlkD|nr:DNA alkylation repair protein [Bacteroidota bacterium]
MTFEEVMDTLESSGDAQTKKTLGNHGAQEPYFGVKVSELKKILKKTKKNHELSLELYATGNSDAMYLAALCADENKMTETILDTWAEQAYWYYLSEYAVPWVAGDTSFGFDIGLKWIESNKDQVRAAGWAALASYAAVNDDSKLDINAYSRLLDRAEKEVHNGPDRIPFVINGFIIAIGSYVEALTEKAKTIAKNIGKVEVVMATAACKVPLAIDYIKKVEDKGRIGKKRKTARC